MKNLTKNQSELLKILLEVYDNSIQGDGITTLRIKLRKAKITNNQWIIKVLQDNKIVSKTKLQGKGYICIYKWESTRPTYLTAIKLEKLAKQESSFYSSRYKEDVCEPKIKEPKVQTSKIENKMTNRNDFINMFDNIVNENKQTSIEIIEAENKLKKANLKIIELESRFLESYTTILLFGLIKITTKLNYKLNK